MQVLSVSVREFAIALGFLSAVLLVNYGSQTTNLPSGSTLRTSDPEERRPTITTIDEREAQDADVTNIDSLLAGFEVAKGALWERLTRDYGVEYVDKMFKNAEGTVSAGRFIIAPPSDGNPGESSWDWMKQRMVIKLIDVLSSKTDVKYVWATGGHSSAAGHGNFFDESYTAVLERSAGKVFEAVGIQLIGRNYAVGGTDSAPEAAWCNEEIYGTDLDVLSWDFGMTDGRDPTKMSAYCYRAALNPAKPACIALHAGTRSKNGRDKALGHLEKVGATVLMSDDHEFENFLKLIPDSAGLDDHELGQLPPFLRNFKCEGQIESGEPYCRAEKFNMTACTNRKYMAKWHPGWKYQAWNGNLFALFLIELLGDALSFLKDSTQSLDHVKEDLLKQENDRRQRLLNQPMPDSLAKLITEPGDLNMEHLFKKTSYCFTARLPSEIRHKGILTGSPAGDIFNVEEGMVESRARSAPNDQDNMLLVQDPADRQVCEIVLNVDHKDYFYVRGVHGPKTEVLPTDRQLAAYGTGEEMVGLIALCFSVCNWGKCPQGDVQVEHYEAGHGNIEINGNVVTGYTKVGRCALLRGPDGSHYFPPNADSKFEIKVTINYPGSFTRIGAFVVL